LREYLGIKIDGEGRLCYVPHLLRTYVPPMRALPAVLAAIGAKLQQTDVGGTELYEACARELSDLYIPYLSGDCDEPGPPSASQAGGGADALERRIIEHHVLPALKTRHFAVPESSRTDGTFRAVTTLPDLYRVFERC
jgi:hypothetical protein